MKKQTKKCFKCGVTKSILLFYKHKQMSDGYLGKCKSCTKKDVKERYYNPLFSEKIKEYERKRFKNPERKKKIAEYQKKRREKYPRKNYARSKIGNLIRYEKIKREPCEICASEKAQAHHLDYRKPLHIKWLCFKHHREEHGQKK